MLSSETQDIFTQAQNYIGLKKQELSGLKLQINTNSNEIQNILFQIECLMMISNNITENSVEIIKSSELVQIQQKLTCSKQSISNFFSHYYESFKNYKETLLNYQTTLQEKREELAQNNKEYKRIKQNIDLLEENFKNQQAEYLKLNEMVCIISKEFYSKTQILSECRYSLINISRKHFSLTSELKSLEEKVKTIKSGYFEQDPLRKDLNKEALVLQQSFSPTRSTSPSIKKNSIDIWSIRDEEHLKAENHNNQIKAEKLRLNQLLQEYEQYKIKLWCTDLKLFLLFTVSLFCTHLLISINYN